MYQLYFYTTSSGRRLIKEFINKQDKDTQTKIIQGLDLLEKSNKLPMKEKGLAIQRLKQISP